MAERIRLEGDAQAPGIARDFVVDCLRYWGYDSIVPSAQLLTSEVVTNAVRHAGGVVAVELDNLTDSVLVVVEDSALALPTQRSPGPYESGGRGLHMVAAMSSAWGVAPMRDVGKYVWFRIAMTGPRSPLAPVACG